METANWQSCAGYLGRVGSILSEEKGWKIGALTEKDGEMAIGEGGITAMQAKEELINPHTVSRLGCLRSARSVLRL